MEIQTAPLCSQSDLGWEQRPSHFLNGQRSQELAKKTGSAEANTPPSPTQAKDTGARCVAPSGPKSEGFLPKAVGVNTLQLPLTWNNNENRCTLATTLQAHI